VPNILLFPVCTAVALAAKAGETAPVREVQVILRSDEIKLNQKITSVYFPPDLINRLKGRGQKLWGVSV
jgi:hypothetical protein